MRTVCVAGILGSLIFSSTAGAAIQYEFRQVSYSDIQSMPGMDASGKVTIDGDRSRVDFAGTSVYGSSSSVISHEGGRRLYILDREKKTYGEVDVTRVAMAVGSKPIQIRNLKTDVQKLDDHPIIAGYPTDHYRLQASYDVTVSVGSMPLTQSVNTVIDRWGTSAFGDVTDSYLTGGVPMTGNVELDRLLAEEGSKLKGFSLRQVTTITTSGDQRKQTSELKMSTVRRQTAEMIVTGIRLKPSVDPSMFAIPAGYTHGTSKQSKEDSVKMLSLEPAATE